MSPPRLKLYLAAILSAAVLSAVIWDFVPLGRAPDREPAAVKTAGHTSYTPPAGAGGLLSFASPGDFPPPGDMNRPNPAVKGNDPAVFWQNVQDALSPVVRERFPELRLSAREIRELTENIRVVHESLSALRDIPRAPENAVDIRVLADRLDESSARIQDLTGMSTAEFLNRLSTEGIDNDKPEKGEVVLEYLDPPGR